MAAPILLVHDDQQVIATLRRLLAREGYEVVLATSAADAVLAFGAHLPALILLSPTVESGRGHVVLEELRSHPDAKLVRVLLLGESVPGFGYPIAPMPPDDELMDQLNSLIHPSGEWTMSEPTKTVASGREEPEGEPVPAVSPPVEATAGWRARPPPEPDLAGALFGDLPDLEEQLHQEVEAEATASLQSRLASVSDDPELDALEQEVRAESQRRRQQREAAAGASIAAPPSVAPAEPAVDQAPPTPPPPPTAATLSAQATLDELEQRKAAASERAIALEEKLREAEAAAEAARTRWASREVAANDAVAAAEAALEAARAAAAADQKTQAGEVEQLRRAVAAAEAQADREHDQRQREETARAEVEAARAALETEKAALAAENATLAAEKARLESEKAAFEGELKALKERSFDTQGRLNELDAALVKAQAAHEETRTELALLSEEHTASSARLEDEQKRARERSEAAAELEMKLLELEEEKGRADEVAKATGEQLLRDLQHERTERGNLEARQRELEAQLENHRLQLGELRAQLEGERQAASLQLKLVRDEAAKLAADLQDRQAAEAEARSRAEAAESAAKQAEEQVRELEDRAVLPLAPPGKPALGVPRSGNVSLGELARLMATLTLGGAEVRLELAVPGGARNLWLKRGQLIAAESSLPYETLSDRARRDGLIDARQESELSSVRGASASELLDVMKHRGLVRAAEVPGLVQRYTEAVALDAFTESQCSYRLHDEPPGSGVLAATATRGVLPMVAEALRRVLPVETQLEALGGSEAVPHPTDTDLDARALGFTERERRMLSYVDGEATIEDVVLAAGIKPDNAYKVLSVAKYLGLIEVRAPAERRPEPSPELDVQRLDAKFEQVQEADYFTILGLPRNAGTDEVQRAYERLADEYDPLRFSGHPDASLQQRAAVVHRLIEEAARALEDDRRRAEYARHLLD